MVEDLKARVAAVVRAGRTGRRMTQEDVAGLAGISVQAVSAIENQRALPSLDTLVILAEVLGFELNDLTPPTGRISEDRLALEVKARSLIRRLDDTLVKVAIKQLSALVEYVDRGGRAKQRSGSSVPEA